MLESMTLNCCGSCSMVIEAFLSVLTSHSSATDVKPSCRSTHDCRKILPLSSQRAVWFECKHRKLKCV
jgi:hypothetical protein